jgi:hypothetical protein
VRMPDLIETKSLKSIKVPRIIVEEAHGGLDWDHEKLEELKEMQRQEEQKEMWASKEIEDASEDGYRIEKMGEISSRSIEPKKSKML